MADMTTDNRRYYIMSQIRSSNTKPEILLRHAFWHRGFRYHVSVKGLSIYHICNSFVSS